MSHPVADLTALLDGALAPERRREVEAHLSTCAACRAERDRLASALAAAAALSPPPGPSPGFDQRFYARLARERGRPSLLGRVGALRWRLLAPAAGAAAVAALAVAVAARHRAAEADMARNLDLLENYELVASLGAAETAEDVEVVAHLHELPEGRP
jgi:anti-sigma factor RsiW